MCRGGEKGVGKGKMGVGRRGEKGGEKSGGGEEKAGKRPVFEKGGNWDPQSWG